MRASCKRMAMRGRRKAVVMRVHGNGMGMSWRCMVVRIHRQAVGVRRARAGATSRAADSVGMRASILNMTFGSIVVVAGSFSKVSTTVRSTSLRSVGVITVRRGRGAEAVGMARKVRFGECCAANRTGIGRVVNADRRRAVGAGGGRVADRAGSSVTGNGARSRGGRVAAGRSAGCEDSRKGSRAASSYRAINETKSLVVMRDILCPASRSCCLLE